MDRIKLHNAKSLKFYPEECQKIHRISFRHKNSSFDSTPPPPPPLPPTHHRRHINKKDSNQKKHSVYVHSFNEQPPIPPPLPLHVKLEKGDFTAKDQPKSKLLSVIDKLEEAYWANWKPNKSLSPTSRPQKVKNSKKDITIIKEPNKGKSKNDIKSSKINVESKKSQEVQTEILEEQKVENKSQEEKLDEKPAITEPSSVELTKKSSKENENKFLKHTDSMILHAKNQNKEKEHVEQPKYIKLTKKTTTKNYIKGGSYPLKSTLKTPRSTVNRGIVRLGRPGNPLIVSNKQYRK